MNRSLCLACLASVFSTLAPAEPRVDSSLPVESVACYDFAEVTLHITDSAAADPGADTIVTGTFGPRGGPVLAVDGFCDAVDGSVFRIRFMPTQPGAHDYAIVVREGGFTRTLSGSFEATDGRRRGLVRVDPVYPAHLQWTGSKERLFWNGLACEGLTRLDEAAMRSSLEHLDRHRITGLRITLTSPTGSTASDLAAWSSLERLVTLARARDMVVALVLPAAPDATDAEVDPRWIRQAAARVAAYSNILWEPSSPLAASDATSRPDPIGAAIAACDPYGHIATGFAELLPLEPDLQTAWQHALSGRYSTLRAELDPTGLSDGVVAELLESRGHLFDLFTGITWWELRTDEGLVVSHHPQATAAGTFAARNPEGDLAIIYVRGGGVVSLRDELLKDQLKPLWFSPRDGGMRNARALRGRTYRTPTNDDWVLLFRTPCNCSFRDFDNERE